ncbi:hypothetical protein [Pedobacter frigidisoli]|uniref:hypothetical protein n=1 Tax=Pedobacter frigidisoli TaxID=2530455 RepID=UPI0029306FD5|nr:hypothetical protein [Pedobacter frigidisoli]
MIKKVYWFLFIKDLNVPAVKPCSRDHALRKTLVNDIAILVLLSYFFAVFNTSIPIVSDGFAHIFFEKHHLQTQHKSLGRDHLNKVLSKLEKQQSKEKSSGSLKQGLDDLKYLPGCTSEISSIVAIMISVLAAQSHSKLYSGTFAKNDPPPEYRR